MIRYLSVVTALAAVAVATLVVTPFALAQGDTIVEVDGLFGWMRPYILELLSLVVGAAVLWATKKFSDLTGINIEAKHREALQSALNNGVALAMERFPTSGSFDAKSPGVAAAIRYVIASVPDAVDYFDLTPERIADLLRPKVVATSHEPKAIP